ncbi:hypothetical protein [Candidatus Methylocalor cossyra]|uniref:Uncharacterized protein n=1 Tax=Candidatus Methylocalor cossyra TaxID=3108543 RepID=A0ABM9NN94_9GAMM
MLEYAAAHKIVQGLGAHLEDLDHVVPVPGESARLLPVSEPTQYLFDKEQTDGNDTAWNNKTVTEIGETTLDRVHQAIILFAAGRSEALKRFLVEDRTGRDQRFWRLAQVLSALYPAPCSEKRPADGVLARKKGLG